MIFTFALVRALHLAGLMILFGSAILLLRLRARLPELGLESGRLRHLRLGLAGLALVTALCWFGFTAAQMAGDPQTMLDPKVLLLTLQATLFGQIFIGRLVALILLCGALLARREILTALLSGLALALVSVTSHAADASPAHFAAIGTFGDALHLLCGGIWLGGLCVLAPLMTRRRAAPRLAEALNLFAGWGMIAVALLVMTGLINAASIVLGAPGHASTQYLGVLGAKLVLVLVMAALALSNHFRLMPRLTSPLARPQASATLKGNIAWELSLGLIVVLLAGLLGLLNPTL